MPKKKFGMMAMKQMAKNMAVMAATPGSKSGGLSSSSLVSGMTIGIGSKIHGMKAVDGRDHGDGLQTNGDGMALTGIVAGGVRGKKAARSGQAMTSLRRDNMLREGHRQSRHPTEWTSRRGALVVGTGSRLLRDMSMEVAWKRLWKRQ